MILQILLKSLASYSAITQTLVIMLGAVVFYAVYFAVTWLIEKYKNDKD